MRVEQELAKEFIDLFFEVTKETAISAHNYLASHPSLHAYGKYPKAHLIIPKSNPEFAYLYETVPCLQFNIPFYIESDFPDNLINYNGVFWSLINKDTVDCTCYNSFSKLIDFINNSDEIKTVFEIKQDTDVLYRFKRLINDVVERYMFITKATRQIPSDIDEQLKKFINEKMSRYFSESLDIQIMIPICLVSFEEDEIILNERVTIKRIPDDIQKSRQFNIKYEAHRENDVSTIATHMVVIDGYYFKNTTELSINTATQNSNAYPLDEINLLFSAIRIVTGYSTGYMQIITKPLGWIDSFSSDLIALYGAKTVTVNPIETQKIWLQLPVTYINKSQTEHIKNIYYNMIRINDNKLFFAAKRLSRCMLRNEEDDMITDAAIGLEALLSGGTMGEITYTLSNRIPIVFSKIACDGYNCLNSRSIMKKIYSYRSKIVHGASIKEKDKTIEINGENVNISNVAVDFLRYTLLFMIENEMYLNHAEIDNYIDKTINQQLDYQ